MSKTTGASKPLFSLDNFHLCEVSENRWKPSNINALQSNTADLATAISVHTSNIGSLDQSVITFETDANYLMSSLSDNSSRITTIHGDLVSNANRISTLESVAELRSRRHQVLVFTTVQAKSASSGR